MSLLIVADTGPLIALAKVDQLDLLRHFYEKISIPETVFSEATERQHWQDAVQIHQFVEQYVDVIPDKTGKQIKELLSDMTEHGYRLSPKLIQQAPELSGEAKIK